MNTTIQNFDLLISGKIVPARSGQYFDAIDPSTGEVIARMADASTDDVDRAIVSAREHFDQQWAQGNILLRDRAKDLKVVAQLIRDHAKELADLESLDCGKTIKQTTFIDIPTAADTFEYFSNASDLLKNELVHVASPSLCMLEREPVGVVAAIIPWNYPLIMAAWKIAPALLCGNSVILKPSPLASLSIARLAQLIAQAGLFNGSLTVLTSSRVQAGSELVSHPDVDMVSFSGGTETGKEIMRLAAPMTKKLVLELGGKSANIICADADMDAALGGALSAIFMNQGQMCTAGSRLLVEDSIYDSFVEKLVARAKKLTIGKALDFQAEFGPLISREHRDKVLNAVLRAKKDGAVVLCGGTVPLPGSGEGFYFEPTVLGNVTNDMWIAQEEVFGPVLSVIKFNKEGDALKIANDSPYGLAAMIWTKDLEKANRMARQLRCGTVWINTYGAFNDAISFGGYKQSGFGRELGKEGLLEFTQSKQIVTDQTPGGKPLVAAWF